jgi:hypothetical protein
MLDPPHDMPVVTLFVAASLFWLRRHGFAQQHSTHTECVEQLDTAVPGVQAHCAHALWCKGHACPHALQQSCCKLVLTCL